MQDLQRSGRIGRVPSGAEWESCRVLQGDEVFFHRWDWLQLMAEALGSHFLPLGYYVGPKLVGLIPMLVKQYGPYKSANWVPFPYMGPVIPGKCLREALLAIDQYQARNGIGLEQLCFSPGADVDVAVLEERGYKVYRDKTLIIPLAGLSEDGVLARMTPRGRKNIKQAQRRGVEVVEASRDEVARVLPGMEREVFARQGLPPANPQRAAELAWERYSGSPCAQMIAAHIAGKVAAVSIGLSDRSLALAWYGGSWAEFRSFNAHAALYWSRIRWALRQGCSAIDLVGAPNQGISDFKKSFGALEVPYLVANRSNFRAAAWARSAHGCLTKARNLPNWRRRMREIDSQQAQV